MFHSFTSNKNCLLCLISIFLGCRLVSRNGSQWVSQSGNSFGDDNLRIIRQRGHTDPAYWDQEIDFMLPWPWPFWSDKWFIVYFLCKGCFENLFVRDVLINPWPMNFTSCIGCQLGESISVILSVLDLIFLGQPFLGYISRTIWPTTFIFGTGDQISKSYKLTRLNDLDL